MKLSITTTGGSKYERELSRILKNSVSTSDVQPIIKKSVGVLVGKTPKRSGLTASKWGSVVTKTPKGIDCYITNDHTTSSGIPLVLLIKNGHGTRTGGYVRPNDFITPVVDSAVKDISTVLERKIK